MKRMLIFLLMFQFIPLLAEEKDLPGELTITFRSVDEIEEDLAIRVYPFPEGFEGVDILTCLQDQDYAECERILIRALPDYADDEEISIHLYGTLGMVADFQADPSISRQDKENHDKRALEYYSKAISLATKNEQKYTLHLASFISSQATLYAHTGDLEKAIDGYYKLLKYTGVGRGSRKDELAARAVGRIADLRMEAGHDTTSVKNFLEDMKGHDSPVVAFYSKLALLDMNLKLGHEFKKENIGTAKKQLAILRAEYAGMDSVGSVDLKQLFQSKKRRIKFAEDFMRRQEKLRKLPGFEQRKHYPHRVMNDC